MFGLQIHSPLHREVEGLARLFESRDGLAIIQLRKWLFQEMFKADHAFFINALGEEGHVIATLIEHSFENVLEHFFSKLGVFFESRKRNLGFNHPELSQVASRV